MHVPLRLETMLVLHASVAVSTASRKLLRGDPATNCAGTRCVFRADPLRPGAFFFKRPMRSACQLDELESPSSEELELVGELGVLSAAVGGKQRLQ